MTVERGKNWRDYGPTTYEAFLEELRTKAPDSPILADPTITRACFDAMGEHSRLLTGFLRMECSYITGERCAGAAYNNPFNLKGSSIGASPWASFRTLPEGFQAAHDRISSTSSNSPYKDTTDIPSLIHVYAPSWDGNDEKKYVDIIYTVMDRLQGYEGPNGQPEPGENPVPGRPQRWIINYGHRDLTGGGTPGERDRTDDVGKAVQTLLKANGYEAYVVQEHDGDPDNTMLNGYLDKVGRLAVAIDQKYGPVTGYISFHFEGAYQPGCFAIVPDSAGLIAAATGTADPGDEWANNALDVTFCRELAHSIDKATGLGLRSTGVIEPGLMSERQTGVGADGWRLSEFHETVPIRDYAVRTIMECGAMPLDAQRNIIMQPDFPNKVAQGVLQAIQTVFGQAQPEPVPDPGEEPENPNPEPQPQADFGDLLLNEAFKYLGYPYVWATAGPETFDCSGYVYWCVKQVTKGGIITRDSHGQAKLGKGYIKFEDLEPGDILCFDTSNGTEVREGNAVSHVGIYAGGNLMINALNATDGVVTSDFRTEWWRTNYTFFGGRRLRKQDIQGGTWPADSDGGTNTPVPTTSYFNSDGTPADALLRVWFGNIRDYNKDGVISKAWREQGNATGEYPALVEVVQLEQGGGQLYNFANGLRIHWNGTKARVVKKG